MDFVLMIVFIVGYLFIILEHQIKLDKAATALIMGVVSWVLYSFGDAQMDTINHQLAEHLSDIAGIVFFLIGAMTIVELIDLNGGFQIIIDFIKTKNKRTLLFLISFLTFFLSAILDNLTTAIVMSTLATKLLTEKKDIYLTIGMIVIAANSGGAWSPIGDVTTTMLWIGNQITAQNIILKIFLPSLISMLIPLFLLSFQMKGYFEIAQNGNNIPLAKERNVLFYSGVLLLISVPIFKMTTHLPPYMGMMLAVGLFWLISEIFNLKYKNENRDTHTIVKALERIDLPSILFFLGILLAVAALESSGVLHKLAQLLTDHIHSESLLVFLLGLLSSIFDNVPLVAAVQKMYSLEQYPTDNFFWEFLSYCTGTGGSLLIIGSAAGVAAMGIEKITFFWFLKRISLYALLGYIGGAIVAVLF